MNDQPTKSTHPTINTPALIRFTRSGGSEVPVKELLNFSNIFFIPSVNQLLIASEEKMLFAFRISHFVKKEIRFTMDKRQRPNVSLKGRIYFHEMRNTRCEMRTPSDQQLATFFSSSSDSAFQRKHSGFQVIVIKSNAPTKGV